MDTILWLAGTACGFGALALIAWVVTNAIYKVGVSYHDD